MSASDLSDTELLRELATGYDNGILESTVVRDRLLNIATQLESLHAELRAARADVERLDWLQSRGGLLFMPHYDDDGNVNGYCWHSVGYRKDEEPPDGLRPAIDAARTQESDDAEG